MTSYEDRIEAMARAIYENEHEFCRFRVPVWADLDNLDRELWFGYARAADAACLAAIEELTEEMIKNIAWAIENCQDYGPDHVTEYRGPDDWDDLRGRAPDATGTLSSEAFVRELRDAWE